MAEWMGLQQVQDREREDCMFAPKNMIRAMAFMGNLIALLGLLVVGDALAPKLRTMAFAWMLVVVAITQFILGHRFQRTGSAATVRTVPVRPRAFGRDR